MNIAVLALVLTLVPGVGAADIISWEDTQGVEHYTNLSDSVPQQESASARVVVSEKIWQAAPAAAPDTGGTAADGPVAGEAAADDSLVSRAYLDGLERGMDIAGSSVGGGGGGRVQVSGPLAVVYTAAAPQPYFNYVPPYYPYDLLGFPFLLNPGFVVTVSDHHHRRAHRLFRDEVGVRRDAPFPSGRFVSPLADGVLRGSRLFTAAIGRGARSPGRSGAW